VRRFDAPRGAPPEAIRVTNAAGFVGLYHPDCYDA
jgi:hypothetical protein